MDENGMYAHRLEKLRKDLHDRSIDTFWVLNEENRQYLSGFRGHDGQCDESAGSLFIAQSRQLLTTDFRYIEQAGNEAPSFEPLCYTKGIIDLLPDILKDLKTKRLGFEAGRLSYLQFQKVSEALQKSGISVDLVPCEEMLEGLRIIKEDFEIEAIKRSIAITELALTAILDGLAPGMSEKDVAWSIEREIRERGAEEISFSPIVASGENSALPHAIPTDRKIKSGEPILFDLGSRLDGYCSDMTRTVILGNPDTRFRDVVQTVYDAQQRAIESIRAGVSSKSVDKVARDCIDERGFKGKFGHGLGHGVGLAVHERPSLNPTNDIILKPGMVVTVEPGIYIPGWGGVRLENMVVVQENRAEVLNKMPVLLSYE
ncbi:MAG: Xaa-Pro peptidase family protein [Pseudomonadota bacterium]